MQEDIKSLKKSLLEAIQITSGKTHSSLAFNNDPMRSIKNLIANINNGIFNS